MKKNFFRIFLFLIISVVSFSAVFNITDLNIEADLQKDGSMMVSEAVTYDIDEINGVLFYIDAKGYGGISTLQVFEDEKIYENGDVSYVEVDPKRYEVTEDDGVYRIKLYSKNNNNIRIFKFVYTLPEAIKVYDDVAQLNRKMVGQDWEKDIANVNVIFKVPVSEDYDNSKILIFGHGPLTGEVSKDKNIVKYELKDYHSGDFLEAHILMEPEIFSEYDVSKVIHQNKKQELLDMEKKLADEANAQRKLAKIIYIFGGSFLWIGTILLGYIRFLTSKAKKNIIEAYEKEIPFGKYSREIPKLSPAVVGKIITKNIDANEVLATILDLVRRKILSLETYEGHTILKLIGDINSTEISEEEKIIIDIYINDFGDKNCVDLNSIDVSSKKIARPSKIMIKFSDWISLVTNKSVFKGEINYLKLIELAENKKTLKSFKIVALLIMILSFLLFPFFYPILILIPLSIWVRRSFSKLIPSKKKYITEKELIAFKDFLSDYSQLEEAKISSIHLWESYFVYAVALGVSEKVVKAYKKALDIGIIQEDFTQLSDNLISSIKDMENIAALNTVAGKVFNNYYTSYYNGDSSSSTNKRSYSSVSKSSWSSSSGSGGGFSSGSSGGGGSRGGGGGF